MAIGCWRLMTAPRPGAVAIIQLFGDVPDPLGRLGIREAPVGSIVLRDLCGIDTGLVAVLSESVCQLMPHGGPEVVRCLIERVRAAGFIEDAGLDPRLTYPEAPDLLSAHMLDALARAQSPLAVDMLLAQPEAWRRAGWNAASNSLPTTSPMSLTERDVHLHRLIDPPLVVLWGRPNIGKSTLTNALADRPVSIVADLPGTTRDHVGVVLELAGLVVRFADTPGMRDDPADEIEREAAARADRLAAFADLVILCGDANSPPPPPPHPADISYIHALGDERPLPIRLALRSDLGTAPWPHDLSVSAADGTGIREFALAVRDRLVPPADLVDQSPWRFWDWRFWKG